MNKQRVVPDVPKTRDGALIQLSAAVATEAIHLKHDEPPHIYEHTVLDAEWMRRACEERSKSWARKEGCESFQLTEKSQLGEFLDIFAFPF